MRDFFIEDDNLLVVDKETIRIHDKWDNVVIVPKSILDAYAEEYIEDNFELSEKDGWIRRVKDETV